MEQELSKNEFAANMYSITRFQLDQKLYETEQEKQDLLSSLDQYEEEFIESQGNDIYKEIGLIPTEYNEENEPLPGS